jgi:hypothetical protein
MRRVKRSRDMLHRALGLTPADWRVLGTSAATLASTDLQITLLPYAAWRARVARAMREVEPSAIWTREAQRHADLFGIVARHYPRKATCLCRALSLHTVLAHARIPTTLRIGVRRPREALEGHAWLEQNGRVVYDHPGLDDPHQALTRRRPPPPR